MAVVNELIFLNLVRSLTLKRAVNLIKTHVSFLVSAVTGRNVLWGRPAVLTIEPANVCNLACPLCITGSGGMERAAGKMSLQTFQNIIDKMGDDIYFLLLYHQGEPYLNKHFLDFVRLAKEKRIYCTTSSNGHFFSEETIHATIDSGLDSMIISIDGTTQESFAKYRIRGDLQKVVDGSKLFMQIKKKRKSKTPLIAWQFLVMKHNEHEIPEIKKLAKETGVDRLLIKNIEVHNVQEAAVWLPDDDKYRRYHFDGENLEVKNSDKKSCPRPWLSTLINWDGSTVPCCFDKNGEFDMGNINEAEDFKDIWRNERYDHFRDTLLADRRSIEMCRNCNQGLGSFKPDIPLFKRLFSFKKK